MSELKKLLSSFVFMGLSGFVFWSGFACSPEEQEEILDSVLGDAFPRGLAVASPTASLSVSIGGGALVSEARSFEEKNAELEGLLAGDSVADCALLFNFQQIGEPSCYGPQLNYQNHPDGTPADGQLPSGDLGIWEETEGADEACVAATLNHLLSKAEQKLDEGLYLAAAMRCLMNVESIALPAQAGLSVDMTESLSEVVESADAGATLSNGVVQLESVSDDVGTFLYSFVLERGEESVSISMRHRDLGADEYVGRMWIQALPSQVPNYRAYTLDYSRDGEAIAYEVVGADFGQNASDVFDDEGLVDLSQAWSGNAIRLVANVDRESGDTVASFAWQAGSGDSHARILNVYTDFDDDGAEGCGFFGYGDRFDQSTGSVSDSTIDTFICNWAGPGNSHTGEVGFAQKQCMATDANGVFTPTQSNIAYAPVNACDSNGTSFEYSLPNGSFVSDPITKDLIELSSDTDYAGYSAPTGPIGF